MSKKYIIALLVIITIIAGIIVGVFIANKNKTSNLEPETQTQLAKVGINMQNEIQII